MPETIYRLTKTRYQDTAFSGQGASRTGGRWHETGTPVVYASDSPAGALLEIIVHTAASSVVRHPHVLFSVHFDPDRHLLVLDPDRCPDDWRALRWPHSTQRIGTRWFRDRDSVVLQVPSVIVPLHRNYLINPEHPLFPELQVDGPFAFDIDPRLGQR